MTPKRPESRHTAQRKGDNDQDLRALFGASRRDDSDRAPAFQSLWDEARRQHGRHQTTPVRWRALVAAAAALVVLIGGTLVYRTAMRTGQPAGPASDERPVSFTEWRAPTDFLLRTPGRELLDTVPQIGQIGKLRPVGTELEPHP